MVKILCQPSISQTINLLNGRVVLRRVRLSTTENLRCLYVCITIEDSAEHGFPSTSLADAPRRSFAVQGIVDVFLEWISAIKALGLGLSVTFELRTEGHHEMRVLAWDVGWYGKRVVEVG
jgi:hypothetical protein